MEESHQILASSLAAESFNQLPNALIINSEMDESKDEAILYHSRLMNNGVESTLFEIKGIGHLAELWAVASDEVKAQKFRSTAAFCNFDLPSYAKGINHIK
jgi:acetyl esterase/lipase